MAGNMKVWELRNCKNVVIPEGTEIVGNHWFWGSGIESIIVSASVREIGMETFCNCTTLKRVTFIPGSKLEKIGSGCFRNSGVERIVIPKGVAEIYNRAFEECRNLKDCVFEKGSRLKTIREYMFNKCGNLAKVTLPDGLKSIGDYAFYKCDNLRNILFPDRLGKIGKLCFYESGLETLVLPASMREIGPGAF